MTATTTPRRHVPDEVASRIQAKILDGSLAPGDRLPAERELAAQLRVNRSSVREGLKKLEQLRLVEIQRGSGAHVQDAQHASFEIVWEMLLDGGQPNVPRIRDLLELREVLFPGLLRLALERASDAELESGVASLRRAARLELSDDEFLEALRELQVVFARMTHNRVLLILANSVTRFLAERGPRRDLIELVAERRKLRTLLQRLQVAVSARDAETAARAGRELLRRLTKLLEAGIRT
jgi:GntR family transcriptional repressor for pyruvate dehydrogenase complex